MSKKYKQGPCPSCPSSDAYTEYEDGSSYCYSCGYYPRKKVGDKEEALVAEEYRTPEGEKTFDFIPHRGISEATLKAYGASVQSINDTPYEVMFPYPKGAQKIKKLRSDAPKKLKYRTSGSMFSAGLFGSDKFDANSRGSITICEGEHDALALYEVANYETVPVSVQSSSSALRDVTTSFDYVNSFKKVILAFDNDEPGKKARAQVASLFDPSKVYHVNYTKYKDANEYLQYGSPRELLEVWRAHKKELPEGIIHSFADIASALKQEKDRRIAEYPWTFLQEALFGMHGGELILFKGLEGIGKTEIFRAIEHSVLKNTDHKIGIIRLEETQPETIRGLATYELEAPAMMEDSGISDEDVLSAYKKAVKGDENRLYIQSSFDTDDPDLVLSNIRFLVSGCGCRVIFLDHLSMLVTGQGEEDERKKLDYIVTRLKKMAIQLNFCLVTIMHVNDDGKTRSSRYPPKIANTVIHLERNPRHADPSERNKTYLIVEKGRSQGCKTGPVGSVFYDSDVSYTLKELRKDDDKPTEQVKAVA